MKVVTDELAENPSFAQLWPADAVERRPIDSLIPDPRNARLHSEIQVSQLAASMREWGFAVPVLISEESGIIAGHGRVMAARKLGWSEAPVMVARGWSAAKIRAYIIADNRLAELASWDDELLGLELGELADEGFDLGLIGFEPADIESLQAGISSGAGSTQNGAMAAQFMVAPFSVLNARDGWWLERKRSWLALGIKSESGRAENLLNFSPAAQLRSSDGGLHPNTSVFDPVLCELAYRWFCPAAGQVLDPFAGGSVRGIIASKLGRPYLGIDLSAEQLEENRAQALAICAAPADEPIAVKVSAKMARLKFNGCDPEYIRTVCHASCCESSAHPSGTRIAILPQERAALEARGAIVDADNYLQPVNKRCAFKTEANLCGLHQTLDKPFGCIASPFTLNDNDTLIVRNRYTRLKCYKDGRQLPAYVAFRASLNLLFGADEAQRICEHLAADGGDIEARMPAASYARLRANESTRRGANNPGGPLPQWVAGDSRDIAQLAPGLQADFIFSCPPYADLERYSDDPRDLSTLDWADFRRAYRAIIAAACAQLKPHRFAAFVVGEARDKRGAYYDLVGETVQAFRDAGLDYYNEAIYVTPVGSLPIRAGRNFSGTRKLGKTHQQMLIFCKGDAKKATLACGAVDFDESLFELAGDEQESAGEASEEPER